MDNKKMNYLKKVNVDDILLTESEVNRTAEFFDSIFDTSVTSTDSKSITVTLTSGEEGKENFNPKIRIGNFESTYLE